jgi:rhodanese-related sulfurtransferase
MTELSSRVSELAGLERTSLVLVCRTDRRSATAARLLREAGFAHVAVLRSGMEQWNKDGLPVEADGA